MIGIDGGRRKNFHVTISICGCDTADWVVAVCVWVCSIGMWFEVLNSLSVGNYLIISCINSFINSKQNVWFRDKSDILRSHNGQTFRKRTWAATSTIKQMKRNETKTNQHAMNMLWIRHTMEFECNVNFWQPSKWNSKLRNKRDSRKMRSADQTIVTSMRLRRKPYHGYPLGNWLENRRMRSTQTTIGYVNLMTKTLRAWMTKSIWQTKLKSARTIQVIIIGKHKSKMRAHESCDWLI